MCSAVVHDLPVGGFCFENYQRNEILSSKSVVSKPVVRKTGTTIAGIVFADGVILGADTRATEGSIVANKVCQKIHYLAPNMYCCGAGTAADTEATNKMVASQLELHRLNSGKEVPVCVAVRLLKQYLFRYQGHISAALVLGGVDSTGAHLYSIAPHGSSDKNPYVTMGSGSLAAMAVFEDRWKPDLTLEEGKKLVRDAIAAGIFNDLGSGSNVDLCVITKDSAEMLRPYEEANQKGKRQGRYLYKRGTTDVLTTKIIPLEVEETNVRLIEAEPMDTSS